jgi:hypothetical protein
MLIGSLHHFCMIELFVGEPRSRLTHRQYAEQVVDVLLASDAKSATQGGPAAQTDKGRVV